MKSSINKEAFQNKKVFIKNQMFKTILQFSILQYVLLKASHGIPTINAFQHYAVLSPKAFFSQNRRSLPIVNMMQPNNQSSSTIENKMIVLDTLATLRAMNKSFHEEDESQFHFEKNIKQNFTMIGGYHEIKEELQQMKQILQESEKYEQYNIRTPKGLLLEGPPGNGKTLLAKCFAGECGFNFIAVSGAEFNEKYVGVGAARVREIFDIATKNQPSIIFIDELDALGGKRNYNDEGSVTERFQTLNQLLVLMDGFASDKMKQVFVIAATNRKDILDSALLRSGRFDKIVHVPNPDKVTRREIINIHREKKPITHEIHTEDISEATEGLSGADIENILNEVSLLALRKNKIVDSIKMIEEIRDKLILGVTSHRKKISMTTKRRIAIHESGHLFMSLVCPLHEKPKKVTIDSSGKDSLGYTYFGSGHETDAGLYSKQYLKEKIMTLLGGRVSEEIFYHHEISTGSVDDMQRVIHIAQKMMMEHGMTQKPLFSFMSQKRKEILDKQIQQFIEESHDETKKLLCRNQYLLFWFANELMVKKTMNEAEILMTLKRGLLLYPSKDIQVDI